MKMPSFYVDIDMGEILAELSDKELQEEMSARQLKIIEQTEFLPDDVFFTIELLNEWSEKLRRGGDLSGACKLERVAEVLDDYK